MLYFPPPEMISHQFKADQIHHSTMSKTPRQIEWILLHSSEGTNSLGWLTTDSPPPNNVSAHALINRIGHRYHLVDPQDVAYHAGVCRWGITNYNSLGIEIENKSELGTGVSQCHEGDGLILTSFPKISSGHWSQSTTLTSDVSLQISFSNTSTERDG
jgi:hypothetical protein